MSDVIRILRKLFRPFGYDLRKVGQYTLLPIAGADADPVTARVRVDFDGDGDDRPADGRLDSLKIILRTCIRADRNPKSPHGVAGATLDETVVRCLASLVRSVNAAGEAEDAPTIDVLILDDHSEDVYLDELRRTASALRCPWRVETTRIKGQGASLYEQFDRARTDDALYYFCEDDYLHEEAAVIEMYRFYRQIYAMTRRHLVLHPQAEYTYKGGLYPSYLILSPTRYWRTTAHMTHVLFTHAFVLRDEWACFENTKYVGDPRHRHLGSESNTTNHLFTKLMGFTPIPPLAGHLQSERTLPPLFDWRRLW